MPVIAAIIRGEICPIARYTRQRRALMAESVSGRLAARAQWPPRPVAGNGRLIAGHRSISDRSYRMVSLGYVSQDLAASGAASIGSLQIYGYVSSICTKAKTLLSPLASVIDFLQMWLRQRGSTLSVPSVPGGSSNVSFCDNVNVIAVTLSI